MAENVNERTNIKGQALLHLAAENNKVEEVERLLSLIDVKVDITDRYDRTPLHCAAIHNEGSSHFDTIKLLLSNGAQVNALNKEGKTPLHYAAQKACDKTIKLFLDFKADLNIKDSSDQFPIFEAIKAGNEEAVQLLLDHGFDVNKVGAKGSTSLHLAADCNEGNSHSSVIEILLKNGANANAQDNESNTPLHWLVRKSDVETVQLMLNFGANVRVENYDWEIPLFDAIRYFNPKILQLLIDNGSKVNVLNDDGRTPLELACMSYHHQPDVIKCLVKNGAIIDASLIKYFHVSTGHIKIFLKYSDVNHVDENGENILSIDSDSDFCNIILKHLAKLQALDLSLSSSLLDTISSDEDYSAYFIQCKEELERAKNTKLHDCWVTFFNLLVDHRRKLKNYAGNRALLKEFKKSDCSKKFSTYGAEMKKRVRKAVKVRESFDKSAVKLSDCLPIFNPNHLIIGDILDCLTFKDYTRLVGQDVSQRRRKKK